MRPCTFLCMYTHDLCMNAIPGQCKTMQRSATLTMKINCIQHAKLQIQKNLSPRWESRARNNGRSTDNVRTDCGFDRSNFRLAGHVDRSKFNRIENEINLRFLLFSCFSCYLSSRCVLRNFDMKSWWHATRAVVYNSRIETDIGIRPLPVTKLPNISTFISNFQVVHLSLRIN